MFEKWVLMTNTDDVLSFRWWNNHSICKLWIRGQRYRRKRRILWTEIDCRLKINDFDVNLMIQQKYRLQIFYSDETGDGSTNYDNMVKRRPVQ